METSAPASTIASATPDRPYQVRPAFSSSSDASTAIATTATRTDGGIDGAAEVPSAGGWTSGTRPAGQTPRPAASGTVDARAPKKSCAMNPDRGRGPKARCDHLRAEPDPRVERCRA